MPPRSPKLRPPCPIYVRAGGAKWYCTVGRKGHGGNHVGNRSEDEYRRLVAETKAVNEEIMIDDDTQQERLTAHYGLALETMTKTLLRADLPDEVLILDQEGQAEAVAVMIIDALHSAGFVLHYTGPRHED